MLSAYRAAKKNREVLSWAIVFGFLFLAAVEGCATAAFLIRIHPAISR